MIGVWSALRKAFGLQARELDLDKVFFAYASILETELSVIDDVAKLPAPKVRIKEALLQKYSLPDAVHIRSHIITAYLSLSSFQELTNEDRQALAQWDGALALGEDGDVLRAAEAISNSSDRYQSLVERVNAEADELQAELRTAGVDLNA